MYSYKYTIVDRVIKLGITSLRYVDETRVTRLIRNFYNAPSRSDVYWGKTEYVNHGSLWDIQQVTILQRGVSKCCITKPRQA
jgi:hypothetical protein